MLALELVPRLRPRSASPSPFPRSPSSLYRLMLAGDKACKPSRYRPPAFISTPHLLQRLPTDVSLFDAPAEGIAAHLDESLFREMYTSGRQLDRPSRVCDSSPVPYPSIEISRKSPPKNRAYCAA